jgi:alpha-beta hydrolase superfamily lysophospholipase
VTTPAAGHRAETEAETERRMRHVAAELRAAGLDACMHDTRGVPDVRATLRREGRQPLEVTFDCDGYVQIAYWHHPGVTPAQVVATIKHAVAVITRSS